MMITKRSPEERAPFQNEGIDFLSTRYNAYLGDEMRLGKSCQVVGAADRLGLKKGFIECPASVKIGWMREFDTWGQQYRSVQIVEGTKCKISKHADITIFNYDLLQYDYIFNQLIDMEFQFGVPDEAHYLKGTDSIRTKRTLSMELGTPLIQKCMFKWFLSGTPILNRPVEFYPVLASCAPHVIAPYNSYMAYTKHFCGGYHDGMQWIDKGATNIDELNYRLWNSGFFLRRLRKDVLNELPKVYQLVTIKGGFDVEMLIAQEFKWHRSEAEYQEIDPTHPLATTRRLLGLSKINAALTHIRYLLTVEEKVVIMAYHKEVIAALKDGLSSYRPVVIAGGLSAAKKKEAEDTFKDDPRCRLVIGQWQAAGQGLDFCAAKIIFGIELDWTPGILDQGGDRCSGFNQDQQVYIQYLVYMGSLDEHQLRVNIEKKNVTRKVIELRR